MSDHYHHFIDGQYQAGSDCFDVINPATGKTLAEVARQHFCGTLKGTLTVTSGLGGMGGAQPLAVTMNEGINITVEVDKDRIKRRIDSGSGGVKRGQRSALFTPVLRTLH